jgi:hypothetical protein
LGHGRRPGYYGEEASEDGCQFILEQLQFVGASLCAARGQAGVLAVAMLEPLVGSEASEEGQDLNAYADVRSSASGDVAQ